MHAFLNPSASSASKLNSSSDAFSGMAKVAESNSGVPFESKECQAEEGKLTLGFEDSVDLQNFCVLLGFRPLFNELLFTAN